MSVQVGITASGIYIPYSRIPRKLIADAWGRGAQKGERSVAGTDEDAVTMAVEAVRQCFHTIRREDVTGLYFASTTTPYVEKSHATLVATACDLADSSFTSDFSNSTKSAADALKMALDAAASTPETQTVVVGSDCRKGYPKSDKEQLLGDAAAAVAVGSKNVIAELMGFSSVNTEIIDIWRNTGEQFLNVGEGRFISTEGYTAAMSEAVKAVLEKVGIAPDALDRVIFTTPDMRSHTSLAKKLKINPEKIQNPLMLEVGDCGNAQALLLLAAALETAKPGDTLLLAAYGSGADAFVFKVTDAVASIRRAKSVDQYLNQKRTLTSYAKFLSFRDTLTLNPGEPFRTFPSNAGTWRDQKSILRFHGSRCKKCGEVIFPINRVCNHCGSVDEFEEVPMQDRTSKVFTYTIDRLAGRGDDPIVVQTVAEDADGCRHYTLMTDFEEQEVHVGMEVEYTFRKIYKGGNYINYFWNCRPVREETSK